MTTPLIAAPEARAVDRHLYVLPASLGGLFHSHLIRSGVALAFLLSGLFRLAAFVRETYVATRFGLSTATDAYYGLQQLPLSVSTFMFGAFALAFAPAYAHGRQRAGRPEWFSGLLLHGTLAGLALTGGTVALAPVLLGKYIGHADGASLATLYILSTCYIPVIYLGIWVSMLNATGRAIVSMAVAALPYLLMTVSLIVICETAGGSIVSLPVSMSLGFWLAGAIAGWNIFRGVRVPGNRSSALRPLRFEEFRVFSKQMLASAAENAGFAGNQFLMIYFFGLMGAGQVTANNYAMRIGLLASGLIAMPLAQLAQSRFCGTAGGQLRRIFSTYLTWTVSAAAFAAFVIYILRERIVALLYVHGRFRSSDAQLVTALIAPWLIYLLILSSSSVVSRYLFVIGKGKRYAGFMLGGYLLTNALRAIVCAKYSYAPAIVWCAVIGEGTAILLILRSCYRQASKTGGDRFLTGNA